MDLESIYRRHAPDVLRFALYLSGNRAEAEDITSETFIRMWTARDDLRLPTVRSYLFAIARNLYLQGCKRRGRSGGALADELPDPAPGPEVLAAGRGRLDAVLADLQALPEVDRAALLMRAVDGMPYAEIAAALGLTLAAAKVKVHRARLKLADAERRRDDIHERDPKRDLGPVAAVRLGRGE